MNNETLHSDIAYIADCYLQAIIWRNKLAKVGNLSPNGKAYEQIAVSYERSAEEWITDTWQRYERATWGRGG